MQYEYTYKAIINDISGGCLVLVGARPGIGCITFSLQVALNIAQKRGLSIWFQTDNPFLKKALKNRFFGKDITITSESPGQMYKGILVVDFSGFEGCKPSHIIPSMKMAAKHRNAPTVCILPIRKSLFSRCPRLSDFKLGSAEKYIDLAILLHREPHFDALTEIIIPKNIVNSDCTTLKCRLTNDKIQFI